MYFSRYMSPSKVETLDLGLVGSFWEEENKESECLSSFIPSCPHVI
jgi:hypothetical protein